MTFGLSVLSFQQFFTESAARPRTSLVLSSQFCFMTFRLLYCLFFFFSWRWCSHSWSIKSVGRSSCFPALIYNLLCLYFDFAWKNDGCQIFKQKLNRFCHKEMRCHKYYFFPKNVMYASICTCVHACMCV